MLNILKQRLGRRDEEGGFTLIELMVVVLIIAILMAIAIPTFLSARGNAQAKAVEANLHNAITDEQTYLTGAGGGSTYGSATALTSNSVDNALSWTSGAAAAAASGTAPNPSLIYVTTGGTATDPTVTLSAQGGDGNFYYVVDNNGAVTYGIYSAAQTLPLTLTATSWPSSAS